MMGMLPDEKDMDLTIDLSKSDEETHELLIHICQTVVGHEPTEITILTGGVTNALYKCDFDDRIPLLIRVNGVGSEKIIDRKKEIGRMRQVTLKLNAGIIRGAFNNGLVYDYIDGITLDADSVPKHMKGIASTMAIFHAMEIATDSGKQPMLFPTIETWLETVKDIRFENDEKKTAMLEDIDINGKLLPAISKLKSIMQGWPIAFCHNDLLGGNIIFNPNTKRYHFIDHEYGEYNFIAFDIGDHFVEWCGMEQLVPNKYPKEKDQKEFVTYYLRARYEKEPTQQEIDITTAQCNIGGLASNIFWAVWAIFQAANSKIKFDYLDYARVRANLYHLQAKTHYQAYEDVKQKYAS